MGLLKQHEFCCVNQIGRSRRTWETKRIITPTSLNMWITHDNKSLRSSPNLTSCWPCWRLFQVQGPFSPNGQKAARWPTFLTSSENGRMENSSRLWWAYISFGPGFCRVERSGIFFGYSKKTRQKTRALGVGDGPSFKGKRAWALWHLW